MYCTKTARGNRIICLSNCNLFLPLVYTYNTAHSKYNAKFGIQCKWELEWEAAKVFYTMVDVLYVVNTLYVFYIPELLPILLPALLLPVLAFYCSTMRSWAPIKSISDWFGKRSMTSRNLLVVFLMVFVVATPGIFACVDNSRCSTGYVCTPNGRYIYHCMRGVDETVRFYAGFTCRPVARWERNTHAEKPC